MGKTQIIPGKKRRLAVEKSGSIAMFLASFGIAATAAIRSDRRDTTTP